MSLIRDLIRSLQANVQKLEEELLAEKDGCSPHLYEAKPYDQLDDPERNPSKEVFSQIQKIHLDLRAVESIVTPTRQKYLNIAFAANKASALDAAASLGISDAIVELGGAATLQNLAKHLEVNENKLGRVLRLLAGEFIYMETSTNVFANTRHSMGLLKKSNAHYFISISTIEGGISSTGLYENMINPAAKHSFAPDKAPFCSTVSRKGQTFFQHILEPENSNVLEKVIHGVVPWLNKTTRPALLEDYPWEELGDSTVVDVGCGPGDSALDILDLYPKLRWIFQDFQHVIDAVKLSATEKLADRVRSGDISFISQDYFEPNISRGNVWFIRGVIREYDDDVALSILRHIALAMRETKGAKLLVNEVLCSTPTVIKENQSTVIPSQHIPLQQSAMVETANLITWNTFHLFGGKERSFLETEALLQQAGLIITRFFKFRTFTTMIECIVKE